MDIADAVDTVVCVSAPYQGDEFQPMKAVAMEIADIFAVNKADLEAVDRTVAAIREALSLGSGEVEWEATVLTVSAMAAQGIDALCERLGEHRTYLENSPEGRLRLKKQLRRELSILISKRIYENTLERITDGHIELLLDRKSDPVTLGKKLLNAGRV